MKHLEDKDLTNLLDFRAKYYEQIKEIKKLKEIDDTNMAIIRKYIQEIKQLKEDNKMYQNSEELFILEIKQLKEELEDKSTALLIEIQTGKDLFKKLEKIKELAKVFQKEEWGDCRYIRKIICSKLNKILDSQEKE